MKSILNHSYENLISVDNLLEAWQEFLRGKRSKSDVQIFQFNLMNNILQLHEDLKNKTYKHGGYQEFKINDPKPRTIHKATVRDRLLHHAVYRILYSFYDKTFIADSFSCRNNKGTRKAINRFRKFSYIVSKNNTKTCWILKCDIRKFFANVNRQILSDMLSRSILDGKIVDLLNGIIFSFDKGLPLGNLTSQLFANVYLNELDQFVKHKLKITYYIRYADDFVIFSEDKKYLENLIFEISEFLENKLKLQMHPDKIFIKTLSSGVDFLGWVNFSVHRTMIARINKNPTVETLNSYLGFIRHGNARKIKDGFLKSGFPLLRE